MFEFYKKGVKKVLSIGAHPDDADTSAGGLIMKLIEAGWDARFVSVTNGCSGTYHADVPPEELTLQRRAEAAASGRLFGEGIRYDLLHHTDGRLMPTLEAREHLMRYIRRYSPDLIITNRPNDYHADHRNTSILVQDCSYLLTVPKLCEDTPAMEHMPVILYWSDGFHNPPFRTDYIVPLKEERVDLLAEHAGCHECQYFDWMLWPDALEKRKLPKAQLIADIRARFRRSMSRQADEHRDALIAKHGEAGRDIRYVERYELCEFGADMTDEILSIMEKPE